MPAANIMIVGRVTPAAGNDPAGVAVGAVDGLGVTTGVGKPPIGGVLVGVALALGVGLGVLVDVGVADGLGDEEAKVIVKFKIQAGFGVADAAASGWLSGVFGATG